MRGFLSQSPASVAILACMVLGVLSTINGNEIISVAQAFPFRLGEQTISTRGYPLSANQHENMARYSKRQDSNSCNQGNMGTICTGVLNCPPCWQKNGNKYDCYDYTPEGKCPWGGMWDRKSSGNDKTSCQPGNMQSVPPCTKNCAPCWKNEGSYYSCFDKVNGQCPWPGMEEVNI